MTTSEKLVNARLKVERAKKHIRDLNDLAKTFLESSPYKVATKEHPKTDQHVLYIADVEDTPAEIILVIGDVLHNLRSTLDHMTLDLFYSGSGKPGDPCKHVYFPVFEDSKTYKSESPRKVKGLDEAAIKAIDAIEPYQGGNGHEFWVLHRLDIIDKHKKLVVVGAAFRSIDLGAFSAAQFGPGFWGDVPVEQFSARFRPADNLCPLKAGDELFIATNESAMQKYAKPTFEIAFNELGVCESKPVIETLNHLADLVNNTLTSFLPLVK